MNRARSVVVGVLAVALVMLIGGCAAPARGDDAISDRPVRVVTTTNFLSDTVARIGGNRVEVTGLMGPGVDPHLYRASADDVAALRGADLIIYAGLLLEGRMAELFDDLAARQPTTAATDAIPRSELIPAAADAPAGEEYDPHIWFDPTLWAHVSQSVADALSARDPQHAAEYAANLAAYRSELTALDAEIRSTLAAIPAERRLLVTSHDAFTYFGRRYDLEVAGIQGISTSAEATTADVERVAALVAQRGVPAVFVESSVPRQTVDALVAAAAQQGAQVRIGTELFTDAAGQPGTPEGTYVGMLRANAQRIAEGLGN